MREERDNTLVGLGLTSEMSVSLTNLLPVICSQRLFVRIGAMPICRFNYGRSDSHSLSLFPSLSVLHWLSTLLCVYSNVLQNMEYYMTRAIVVVAHNVSTRGAGIVAT